jgi:signal transduction histidine kinase
MSPAPAPDKDAGSAKAGRPEAIWPGAQQSRRPAVVKALAVLAAATLFLVTEASYQRSHEALASLAARDEASTAIQTVMGRLVDAETGLRGYMLTGRRDYLAPYADSANDIGAALFKLQAYNAHDRPMLQAVHELATRVSEKQSELAETLRLYDGGDVQGAGSLLLTDIGRERMDSVRRAAEALLAAENERVAEGRDKVFTTLWEGRLAVHALTVLSLLALVLFLRQTLALDRAQRRHAAELKAERDALDAQVKFRTVELTELTRHLQLAREDERGRLARELHDELGALLTAAKLDVARVKHALAPLSPEVELRVTHLTTTIDQGIALKRRIIEDLRPSSLSNLGLQAALQIQAREFAQNSGLKVDAAIEALQLPEAAEITVYRVFQESLTNVAKYASATRVGVVLRADGDRACFAVTDDGCGFDPGRSSLRSHGLTGMRYRVESCGGAMRVVSAPGRGTRVEAWVPLVPTPSGAASESD